MTGPDVRTRRPHLARDRLPGALTSLIPLALLVLAVAGFLEVEERGREPRAAALSASGDRLRIKHELYRR